MSHDASSSSSAGKIFAPESHQKIIDPTTDFDFTFHTPSNLPSAPLPLSPSQCMSNSALQQPSKRDICSTSSIFTTTTTAAYISLPSPLSTAYRAHMNSSKNVRESGSIKQERTLPAKRTANESKWLSIGFVTSFV
jgi:hypothetical protein